MPLPDAEPARVAAGRAAERVPCVGGLVTDADGRLLLVRRGQEPSAGTWSVPGGRVEPGEDDVTAVRREVLEETGIRVEVGRLVGVVERAAPGGATYVIADYACRAVGGALGAATDATDAAWYLPEDLAGLDTAPGLVAALTDWRILPGPDRRDET